ncbi:MAG: co-chaperone GroES [Thermodesulfobacteriota bacterium]|jgi:chaperonin GroES|nr:co-chaperone GroES [Candidatus Dadabacteria bacterium]MCZ6639103.1 co-chaperone GroES [Candidatus Dadabacteria bacterium]MCZ6791816.1 co-chaperone GroES [Candidatus Dadabacteria bacterium]MCZ6865678.1 co-chaperone GroES [Candidatus Dadabacteria bacterium]
MKVRPLHDKVLIQLLDAEEKTKGGIIIPETAKEKPQEGKVVAVGTGVILPDGVIKPLDVKKGDKILFSKYGGTEISVEGKDYLIVREDEILAIVTK